MPQLPSQEIIERLLAAENDAQARLAEAEAHARELLAEAEAKAHATLEQARAEAEAEAQALLEQARADAGAEVQRRLHAVDDEIAALERHADPSDPAFAAAVARVVAWVTGEQARPPREEA